ncbi:protein KASH5 [Echinops telfairi]|uniref:Protein KASH5 n=1 Tax=Echinops telfairi TaxID=9371 RepID=A0AC55DA00_ECHTE|nr:protein KASH5 [Echinops telfairi]
MDLPEGWLGDPAAATMHLWDQPQEGSVGTPPSLEEQILNSTFEACDPQRTGTVAVTQVVAYLETVTGRGPQDLHLQTLARSLDPNREGAGATVDLDTFLVVMRDWIAACQLDGGLELEEEPAFKGALAPQQLPSGCPEIEEPANLESFGGEDDPRPELPATAELLSSLEDLELSNRRLAAENAKLQRSVETAEEGTARLADEISALRKQLRRSSFHRDKEQQHLVAKMEKLQEENGKLLAERDGMKRRTEELTIEKETDTPLPWQRHIYECECLICQRDTILSERTRHAESLAKSLEEYKVTTQELRLEISHLEEQLSQTHEGPDELSEETQSRRVGWATLLPPSLGSEIAAIRQKQAEAAAAELLSPLCGVWQWEDVGGETGEEAAPPSEALPEGPKTAGERGSQEGPVPPGEEETEHGVRLPRNQEEEPEAQTPETAAVPAELPTPLEATGDIPGSPPESPDTWGDEMEVNLQRALVPVLATKELVPVPRQQWGQLSLPFRPAEQFRVTRHPLLPTPVLGLLLLLLLSALLLGHSQPPTCPHLQLSYLQPPPM